MSSFPPNLPPCDQNAPTFPVEWKESYFRRHYNHDLKGYMCPICNKVFKGPSGFKMLHGDHIIPRSQGGKTIWENMTLLCYKCNLEKSNKLSDK